ncbi:hypothetical protein IFU39_16755 [Paenibacillus sp. CFBP 13594]|uniref:hypothetical protein n=1 Tax=Paenibacillus sp. CFBP 13594 TaxID=2774037 RepID=UPI00177DD526|nr:hypothetical protein [Paenibacillus sp. CFBP 13594]MBD8839465.1 hypothetical protein [Paenibacillus sp. CFBP 13594]
MKKFALVLMVFVFSLVFSSTVLASGVKQEVKQATMKIEKVYYMKGSGYYVAHTSKDKDGHFWVLQVTDIALHKEDIAFTKALSTQYQGKEVIVTYIEPVNEDEEVEIWTVKLK